MKLVKPDVHMDFRDVAPLVGAWIEINCRSEQVFHALVAPLVGAWIEIGGYVAKKAKNVVAPLVGAWIEIKVASLITFTVSVAPLVGAWIEIALNSSRMPVADRSLPSWERGLKYLLPTLFL